MEPDIIVKDNIIQLSENAVKKLQVSSGDRIAITYAYTPKDDLITNIDEKFFPIISKSDSSSDFLNGNILTKKNSISYRGLKRKALLVYGTEFNIEPYLADNYYKLIKIK